MPKVVDPTQRRQAIGEAVWRVIERDGVEGASVREVALEAGLSTGSLRHYFGSQDRLLSFAMRMVMDRVEARVNAVDRPSDPLEAASVVLAELLPLDAQRELENQVWLAFTARSLVDPTLRSLRDEAHQRLRSACQEWTRRLLPPDSADVEIESERLFALIDGLAVHAAMQPNQPLPLEEVLNHHLTGMARARQSL